MMLVDLYSDELTFMPREGALMAKTEMIRALMEPELKWET